MIYSIDSDFLMFFFSFRRIKAAVKGGPVKYVAPEDKDIWFCNCKQTKNRPFCDGTHREQWIQDEAIPGKFEEIWEPNKNSDR